MCFHPYIWIWCKLPSRTGWEDDFPSPFAVCVSIPGGFVVQDRLLFSPCCELCLLIHFGTVVSCLGVVLATIGPRTNHESFSLSKLGLLVVCRRVMVGLRTVLGVGMGAWFA